MRKLLLFGLLGCWSSSPKPASPPPQQPLESPPKAATGGDTYGGLAYGGEGYAEDPMPAGGTGAGGGGSVPTVSIGDPTAQTGLDPAIIRRYVRRNIQKIQYCYEKELLATPGLAGKVVVRFTITGNGNVAQSTGSGMKNVDACVASVISGIQFPAPQGGGTVTVNYPFIFSAANP